MSSTTTDSKSNAKATQRRSLELAITVTKVSQHKDVLSLPDPLAQIKKVSTSAKKNKFKNFSRTSKLTKSNARR